MSNFFYYFDFFPVHDQVLLKTEKRASLILMQDISAGGEILYVMYFVESMIVNKIIENKLAVHTAVLFILVLQHFYLVFLADALTEQEKKVIS